LIVISAEAVEEGDDADDGENNQCDVADGGVHVCSLFSVTGLGHAM
jgi:hypothetical protein